MTTHTHTHWRGPLLHADAFLSSVPVLASGLREARLRPDDRQVLVSSRSPGTQVSALFRSRRGPRPVRMRHVLRSVADDDSRHLWRSLGEAGEFLRVQVTLEVPTGLPLWSRRTAFLSPSPRGTCTCNATTSSTVRDTKVSHRLSSCYSSLSQPRATALACCRAGNAAPSALARGRGGRVFLRRPVRRRGDAQRLRGRRLSLSRRPRRLRGRPRLQRFSNFAVSTSVTSRPA